MNATHSIGSISFKFPNIMEGSLLMIILVMFASAAAGNRCNQCSPGEFMFSPCKCLPCPYNTFNEKSNNDSKCRPCKTRCEPSMVLATKCTKTSDTKCSCKDGKYREPEILFCIDCAVCPAGYGAVQPCSTDSNTICLACIPGKTYSNETTFSKPCRPCTACPMGQIVSKVCKNDSDIVCQVSVSVLNSTQEPRTRTSRASVSSTVGSSASLLSKDKENNYLAPVLAVVVLLLVCLLIVVGVKLYKSRSRVPVNEVEDTEEGTAIIYKTTPPSTLRHGGLRDGGLRDGGLRGRHTRHLRRADNSRESSDSQGSTGSLQEEKPRNSERLLRELPNNTVIIEKLSMLLNSKGRNNWVRLAGELGYSKTEVDCFDIVPTNATQNLLADWQTTNSSNIGVLYGCLRKMKRDDACVVLEDV